MHCGRNPNRTIMAHQMPRAGAVYHITTIHHNPTLLYIVRVESFALSNKLYCFAKVPCNWNKAPCAQVCKWHIAECGFIAFKLYHQGLAATIGADGNTLRHVRAKLVALIVLNQFLNWPNNQVPLLSHKTFTAIRFEQEFPIALGEAMSRCLSISSMERS